MTPDIMKEKYEKNISSFKKAFNNYKIKEKQYVQDTPSGIVVGYSSFFEGLPNGSNAEVTDEEFRFCVILPIKDPLLKKNEPNGGVAFYFDGNRIIDEGDSVILLRNNKPKVKIQKDFSKFERIYEMRAYSHKAPAKKCKPALCQLKNSVRKMW